MPSLKASCLSRRHFVRVSADGDHQTSLDAIHGKGEYSEKQQGKEGRRTISLGGDPSAGIGIKARSALAGLAFRGKC